MCIGAGLPGVVLRAEGRHLCYLSVNHLCAQWPRMTHFWPLGLEATLDLSWDTTRVFCRAKICSTSLKLYYLWTSSSLRDLQPITSPDENRSKGGINTEGLSKSRPQTILPSLTYPQHKENWVTKLESILVVNGWDTGIPEQVTSPSQDIHTHHLTTGTKEEERVRLRCKCDDVAYGSVKKNINLKSIFSLTMTPPFGCKMLLCCWKWPTFQCWQNRNA